MQNDTMTLHNISETRCRVVGLGVGGDLASDEVRVDGTTAVRLAELGLEEVVKDKGDPVGAVDDACGGVCREVGCVGGGCPSTRACCSKCDVAEWVISVLVVLWLQGGGCFECVDVLRAQVVSKARAVGGEGRAQCRRRWARWTDGEGAARHESTGHGRSRRQVAVPQHCRRQHAHACQQGRQHREGSWRG